MWNKRIFSYFLVLVFLVITGCVSFKLINDELEKSQPPPSPKPHKGKSVENYTYGAGGLAPLTELSEGYAKLPCMKCHVR